MIETMRLFELRSNKVKGNLECLDLPQRLIINDCGGCICGVSAHNACGVWDVCHPFVVEVQARADAVVGSGVGCPCQFIGGSIHFYFPNPDKPEKILQFLHISSTIKKNVGGCVHVTYR